MQPLIIAAPLQGFTEAPFRHFHAEQFGAADAYLSPFLRIEHGAVRPRDLRDIISPLNKNHNVIPQIIFRDAEEFRKLVECVSDAGYNHINLNMGCPFPPQVAKGRGAGILPQSGTLSIIGKEIDALSHSMKFSIKMRLGIAAENEWRDIASIINSMPLEHVTVHPRTATQQYKGELHLDSFAEILSALQHPVIFNGEVKSPEDITAIINRFSGLAGIMIGRGLLSRPSIVNEWKTGTEWSSNDRLSSFFQLHDRILNHYRTVLCGDTQLLTKMKPFWEYSPEMVGRKDLKAMSKASTLPRYLSAVETALHNALQ